MPKPTPAPLPRYVELIRVSTPGQAAKDTPAGQRADLDRLRLQRPGVPVERISHQVSGGADGANRPDLVRLAQLADAKAFDEVRVRHLDRLTRHDDPLERATVLSFVRNAGAIMVDAYGTVFDPSTMQGELSYVFATLGAAEEKRKIRERTMAGARVLSEKGHLSQGAAPWGRTWNKETKEWGIEPKQMAAYRRMFDLAIKGSTLSQISTEMNDQGILTPRGKPWNTSAVYGALIAPHATGTRRAHGIEYRIPAVVDEATQKRALARLKANDVVSGRHDLRPALFRKLLLCGTCGGPMHTDTGWKNRLYYYCKTRSDACGPSHHVEVVDEAAKSAIAAWLRRPEAATAAAGAEAPADEAATAEREAAEARTELRDLDRQEMSVARMQRKKLIRQTVADAQLEEVARLRATAERQLEDATYRAEAARAGKAASAELEERVRILRGRISRAGPAEWRALLETLFSPAHGHGVRIYPDGRIEFHGAVPMTGTGDAALAKEARPGHRVPSGSRPTIRRIPVRLTAWAPARQRG